MQKTPLETLIDYLQVNATCALKDEDYQRRVWFRNEGPEVDSYIDTGSFFCDKGKYVLDYPKSEEVLGKQTYDILKKLYELISEHIDRIEERMDPDLLTEDELLNDPKWHDIQMLAEELDRRLLELLKRSRNEQDT